MIRAESLFHMKNIKISRNLAWHWITTPVGCKGLGEKELKIDKGMPFIEAPKSSMEFSNLLLAIMQATQNVPRSLHFLGIWGKNLPNSADTFLHMPIHSSPFSFLLHIHNSLRNLAYLQIFLIASSKGIFTSTFLKISKISLSTSSICLLGMAFGGKGIRIGDWWLLCALEVEGPTTCSSHFLLDVVGWTSFLGIGSRVGTSIFFPNLNMMTLTFFGFSTICEGNLSELYAYA